MADVMQVFYRPEYLTSTREIRRFRLRDAFGHREAVVAWSPDPEFEQRKRWEPMRLALNQRIAAAKAEVAPAGTCSSTRKPLKRLGDTFLFGLSLARRQLTCHIYLTGGAVRPTHWRNT